MRGSSIPFRAVFLAASACGLLNAGCQTPALQDQLPSVVASDIPRELEKMSYPVYRIEPPDILVIEAVHNIRPPDSPLRAGDELVLRVGNTLPIDPTEDPIAQEFKIINGVYQVQTDGTLDLGPEYGSIPVAGMPVREAKKAIDAYLREQIGLTMPQVSVSMPDVSGKQAIVGEHLVRPDGTVSLGIYGGVYLSGMTLEEAKYAIEAHLSQYIHQPEVNVDVLSYNSKVFYIITDGGGFGETVDRLPCTGNETVLDAIAEIQGLSDVSSKQIWIARPAPNCTDGRQVLNVDWRAITEDGVTSTNYQIFPGDRIYVKADHMIEFDNFVAKVTAPFERIMGFTLFGHGLVRELQFGHLRGGNSSGGGFGGF